MSARWFVWFCCMFSWAALAQTEPKDLESNRRELARKVFLEAEASYQQGDYQSALAGYDQAYALTQEPLLLYNQAQCYRQLKRYQEALDTYQLFLEKAPSSSEYVLKAQQWITDLEKETGLRASVPKSVTSAPAADPAESQPSNTPATTKAEPTLVEPQNPPKDLKDIQRGLLVAGGASGVLWLGFGAAAVGVGLSGRSTQQGATDLGNLAAFGEEISSKHRRALVLGTISDVALAATVLSAAGYLVVQKKAKADAQIVLSPTGASLQVRF